MSWWIGTYKHCLFLPGKSNPEDEKEGDISEESIVSVEKHSAQRTLTFYVNDRVIWENIHTGLQENQFNQLVGCIMFWNKGDAIEIL